jgi:2-dehydro-3-deoxyphosphogluconate aldolase/(4S)-4-hydroxy-2-oxoglutarate aldolase
MPIFGNSAAEVFLRIKHAGIVPVVTIKRASDALPLAKALRDGGLYCAEITFRMDAAEESIKLIASEYPDMLVGAGTVLTPAQLDRAREAGAVFAVSPGLNPTVVRHCIDTQFPFIPGGMTPSDIERALELGLDAIKFFPAEAVGGLKLLKALAAPYPFLHFLPTGGITLGNLLSYLDFDKVIACGGSFMVSEELIDNGRFSQITELTARAVGLLKERHVVIG